MKRYLKLVVAGSLVFLSLPAMPADPPAERVTRQDIVVAEQAPRKFDFSFPGGTMAEFVAQLNKAVEAQWRDQKPNLILPKATDSIRVPKLELRSVDLESLMTAMNSLLNRREHLWRRVSTGTWVLETMPDQRKTQVFYVGHLLAKFKIDDLNTALATVWEMDGESKPELKYHKDTQLLIIRAEKAQLDSALMVLTQLRDALAVPAAPGTPREAAKPPAR